MPTIKTKMNENPITVMIPLDFKFSEDGKSEIQLLKLGEWNHPMYGPVKVTAEVFDEFVKNFKKDLRAHSSSVGLPIDEEHRSTTGAVGWIKKLINRGNEGLFAIVEWNAKGQELIKDAIYRFFSPEFYFQYEDPESRKVYNNVLIGGALTNRPYFKGLNPVVLSENNIINNDKNMILSELIAKNLADLSDAEKSFVASHFSELDEDNKTKFAELNPDKKIEEKKEIETGKISMSETEVKTLREQAAMGSEAMTKVKKMEMSEKVKALIYSETNKENGKLPSAVQDKVIEFAMSLNDDQQAKFFEIVNALPKSSLFSELGTDGAGKDKEKTPEGFSEDSVKLDRKANELMANDKDLSYEKALEMAEKELQK